MATAPDPAAAAPAEPAAPAAPASPAPEAKAPASPANEDMIPVDMDDIMAVFGDGPSEKDKLPNFGTETEAPPTPAAPPPADKAPAAPAPAKPAAAAPAPAAPAALPPLGELTPAPAAAPVTDALKVASLEAQVAALQRLVENQQRQPAEPATPAKPEILVKPEETNYRLSIPPEVLSAVFSEDEAASAQGMTHLINTLAAVVHRNVLHAARTDINGLRQEIQQGSMQDEQSKARDAAQADYYGTFPAHNNPHIKILVAAEAQKLGVEYPQLPWGEQFKNALGARVNGVLESLGAGSVPPLTAPAPGAPLDPKAPVQLKPPTKPASFMPVAPSGGIPSFENDQDVIADTFSFG